MRIEKAATLNHGNSAMLRVICIAITFVIVMGGSTRCRAEIPLISVLIKADGNSKFQTLHPLIERVQPMHVTFALNDKPGVSIILRIRSDAKMLNRAEILDETRRELKAGDPHIHFLRKESIDQITTDLKKLGADSVSLETIPKLPTAEFSIETMVELRKQKRRIIIICHAEWDVPSGSLEKTLLLNEDVISAAKESDAVVMLVDMTHPLREENTTFFRKLRASPLCFVILGPGEDDPVVNSGLLSPNEFIELLASEK